MPSLSGCVDASTDNPPMLTINKLIPGGRGLAAVLIRRAAQVSLDWDVRQKSRFDAVDSLGRTLGVFLPRGTAARGGDVLVAEDGSLICVLAAPQPVLVVRHCTQHGSAFDLLRAAYHLGNRHVALELKPDHLKLEPDHVLADMLRQQHLIVSEALEAFEPEGGAYSTHAAHGAGHGHSHAHADEGGQGHGHGNDHGHDHGHHPGHDHGHDAAEAHARRHADEPHAHPHEQSQEQSHQHPPEVPGELPHAPGAPPGFSHDDAHRV